ncbi:Unconventional myosin-X [Strongyloides ratti]|uniref:Unconventional myosin-X n=1 Tax=Strongyloides ratti TaxID=34506 RepID=A0A090LIY2_STRRB|nr:Unconventional myosin-X [Strongyloides ratti]CEF69757.1 Unconventional myosin-X [Strongyloides ratti]
MVHITRGDFIWIETSKTINDPLIYCNVIGARVMQIDSDGIVVLDDTNTEQILEPERRIRLMHPSSVNGVEDMIQLGDLHDAGILRNLLIRYREKLIYTYTGSILIAVNPYKTLPLYKAEHIRRYRNQKIGDQPPHIFAIADNAYESMRKNNRNQCIVISGESGSGKTESTKLVLQFLTAVSGQHSWIEQQILEANPIMEAFGNSKTIKNDNSSRFGKYIDVQFNNIGIIEGAKIHQYLLEKSRIVSQTVEEKNYHIFYSLLSGLDEEEKEELFLTKPEDYFYLNQGRIFINDGRNDITSLNEIRNSMKVLMFKEGEIKSIFKILSSLLHIGNIIYNVGTFNNIESVEINDLLTIQKIGTLLQLDIKDITSALTTKTLIMRNEKVISSLDAIQALNVRDALVKVIYGKLFLYIINKINDAIYKPSIKNNDNINRKSIGILDIFGFENFQTNSFEQLCINYANEHLQQFFVKHVFKLEQMEYDLEEINWRKIEFIDNQNALDLLAERPMSVMALINEESIFPKGTDLTLLSKLHIAHGKNDNLYVKPKSDLNKSFGIRHYAGTVTYSIKGFLEKNRDTFSVDLLNLISKTKLKFLRNIFDEINSQDVNTSRIQQTLGNQFRKSLDNLIAKLSNCDPYFIRCIKPNDFKQPMTFDRDLVFKQLRYSGMMETIRIRKAGYPIRYTYQAFIDRFRLILKTVKDSQKTDIIMASQAICEKALGFKADFQLGKTKIFLKENDECIIEKHNDSMMNHYATIIQKTIKGFKQKRKFEKEKNAAILIQAQWRGYIQRKKYKMLVQGLLRLQAVLRTKTLTNHYEKQRNVLINFQAECKKYLHNKSKNEIINEKRKELLDEMNNNEKINIKENPYQVVEGSLDYDDSKIIDQIFGEDFSGDSTYGSNDDIDSFVLPLTKQMFINENLSNYQFSKFAATYFNSGINGEHSTIKLKKSLLPHESLADEVASMAIWTMILKFMGDIDDNKNKPTATYDSVPIMTQVYNTLQRNTKNKKINEFLNDRSGSISSTSDTLSSSSRKGIENFGKKLISMTLRKKSKISNIIPNSKDGTDSMDNPFDFYGYTNILENNFTTNMDKLHFIIGHGILRPSLRDEIYCQICKQLSFNDNRNSLARGWILLSLCVGCFAPSDKFIKYLYCFIRQNGMVGKINYGQFIEERLNRTLFNGTRLQPPSYVELQSCKTKKNIILAITFMNGNVKTLNVDSATTSKELCLALKDKLNIKDYFGFSIYIALFDKVTSLGCGNDHVMDAISQCEQYAKETGRQEKNAPWRLFYRKEIFSPWFSSKNDTIACELIYHQIVRGIKHGEYKTSKEDEMASLIARQIFIDNDGTSINIDDIEKCIEKYIPDYEKSSYDKDKYLQMTLHAYRKHFMMKCNSNITVQDVKSSIVETAKIEWPLLFSRFYEGYKFTGAPLSKNEVIIAINWTGFYIVDDKEQILLEFSFPEIVNVTLTNNPLKKNKEGGINTLMNNCFTIQTISNTEFTFQSPNSDDIKDLILYFLKGLKDRSKFIISKCDIDSPEFVQCKKGDLLTILNDVKGKDLEKKQFVYVDNDSTGKKGNVPVDMIYVLPTLTKPTMGLISVFASDNSFYDNDNSNNQIALVSSSGLAYAYDFYDLTSYAKNHFKNEINSHGYPLWKYSREMIKHPLLKKIENRLEPEKEAMKCYMAIMQYMGDYPVDYQTSMTSLTNNIFNGPMKYEILRDEIYCQIIKQLTGNCNNFSSERGWELLWLCCGLFPPSNSLQKEVFAFLRSHLMPIAIDCSNRLQKSLKVGSRKFPPHQVEVSAVQNKTTQIYHKAFFPDGTYEAIEVESMSKAKDFSHRIATRLGLQSIEGYSLFVKVGERVLSVPENEFFFDFINQLYEWIKNNKYSLTISKSKTSNDSPTADGYQVYFMRKLWINVKPGDDINADIIFHYHQELPKYLRGYHTVSRSEAIYIASLLLRSQTRADCHPPFNQFNHIINDCIPKDMIKDMTINEWKKQIKDEYSKIEGMSPDEGKINFLRNISKWPTFGSAFFEVKQTSDSNFPEKLLVAINQSGVNLYNQITKEYLITYSFSQISNWNIGNTYFTLSVGGIMNGNRVLWETTLGYKIDDLLTSYIKCLISNNPENQTAAITNITR